MKLCKQSTCSQSASNTLHSLLSTTTTALATCPNQKERKHKTETCLTHNSPPVLHPVNNTPIHASLQPPLSHTHSAQPCIHLLLSHHTNPPASAAAGCCSRLLQAGFGQRRSNTACRTTSHCEFTPICLPAQNFSVSLPDSLLRSSMLMPAVPPTPFAKAGCSMIAWNSCVPRSALVSGMWPLGAS